jgi:hypothetical protein
MLVFPTGRKFEAIIIISAIYLTLTLKYVNILKLAPGRKNAGRFLLGPYKGIGFRLRASGYKNLIPVA